MGTLARSYSGPFGMVNVSPDSVTVDAREGEREDWAYRPGAYWPCHTPGRAFAGFIRGDLVDFEGPDDMPAHELSAWADDAIRAAGAEDAARAAGYRFHA